MKKLVQSPVLLLLVVAVASCHKNEYTKPQRKDIVDAVFASGRVYYYDEYSVVSNTDGYLKKVLKRQGDSVKAGDTLYLVFNTITESQVKIAELNYADAITKYSGSSPTLKQKKEQVALANKQLKKDSMDYARNKRLLQVNAISKLDFENSEIQYQTSLSNYIIQKNSLAETIENLDLTRHSSKKQLEIQQQSDAYNFLTAGIDGVIAELYLNEGDLVTTGVSIAKITGGQVKAKLYIDEVDINNVKVGQQVLISLNTYTQKSLNAKVVKLYPSFDTQDQAFVAEANFIDVPEDVYLFTQTQLQANIIIAEKKQALVIPTAYLVDGRHVMLKGSKEQRQVAVGIKNAMWVEILSGITEADELMRPKK